MPFGESFTDGILLMCRSPEATYPTGPVANRPVLSNRRPSSGPDIIQATDYYPSRVAGFASEWLDIGAQIVGGCCASGPEHIAAIRRAVPEP